MKVGFISLGCSKNLIDTEMCIGLFKKENFGNGFVCVPKNRKGYELCVELSDIRDVKTRSRR